ncbi:MAG: O-antigen ligase family protein [Anaerolineae bacterium]|nr:O-antigen ligase family protein [Anaerolineae bacterium]
MVTYGVRLVEYRRWAVGLLVIAIGLAIAYLPLTWAGVSILGAIAFLAILIHPHLGLYLLIFSIPFGSWKEVQVGVMSVGVTELLVGLVLAAWLAQMVASREVRIGPAPLLLPLLIFLATISFSLLNALSLQYSLKGLLVWLEILGIYLFVATALGERGVKIAIMAILIAGSLEALLGVYQFLFGVGPESFLLFGRFSRAYGTFGQPNPFGGYLGLILPLALAIAFAGWRRLKTLLFWGLAVIGLAVMGTAMVMSWSRGAWLGALVALGFVAVVGVWTEAFEPQLIGVLMGVGAGVLSALWCGARDMALGALIGLLVAMVIGGLTATALRRRWGFLLLTLLLLSGLLFFLLGGGRLIPTALVERLLDFLPYLRVTSVEGIPISDENYATVERLAHWQAAWRMVSDKPLLGVGIGNYVPVYPAYALPGWADPMGHAHNYYLNIAAEAGLVGLGAYLFLWGAIFWHGWRVYRGAEDQWRSITLGILGVMTAFCLHSLFDNLYVHGMNIHLALLLGLLTVIGKKPREVPCNG